MRYIVHTLLWLLLPLWSYGQFTMDAQIRPRAEFRDGYRQMPAEDSNPGGQVNQRTRLSLSYAGDSRVSARIAIQDLRLWGEVFTMNGEPSFGVYEAWVALHPSERLSITAGRQELRYDTQRLMAINDWALTGRTHDALVARFQSEGGSRLHVGAAFNQSQNRLFETHYLLNNYKTLNYLWYNTVLGERSRLSLHFIADGYEHPNDPEDFNLRYTMASYLVYDGGGVEWRLYPAYQFGKTSRGQDISAWYLMGEAFAPLSESWRATLGFELFSGLDQMPTGEPFTVTFTAFSDLYGMGHARNGFMDYFTAFPQHTENAGLFNPYLRNAIRLGERSTLDADLHLFFMQSDYPDPGDPGRAIDKYLGTEIDLVYSYQFNEFTQLQFGYSVLFGSESMEILKGGSKDEFAHWAFAMIRMTPRFF